MGAHARIPPSDAWAWVPCPARIQMCERFPALTVDPSAAEGEAAHWVAFNRFLYPDQPISGLAPNGLPITDEMLQGADVYARAIRSVTAPWGACSRVTLEKRRSIRLIHPEMFGTGDADVDLRAETGELHFFDYKFGHLEVDPYRNPQLICYLAGKLEELGLLPADVPHLKVVFHIVQPRSYHPDGPVRTWRTTVLQLLDDMRRITAAAFGALGTNPQYGVGPQCSYCPAARGCPALRRNSHASMAFASTGMPVELDGVALGIELRNASRMLELLSARVDALKEQADSMLRNGGEVLHHQIGEGRGATIWTQPPEQVLALGRLLGVNLAKESAPITPTQAKEVFKKSNLDPSVLVGYSKRIPGAKKLCAVDDTTAAKVFNQ